MVQFGRVLHEETVGEGEHECAKEGSGTECEESDRGAFEGALEWRPLLYVPSARNSNATTLSSSMLVKSSFLAVSLAVRDLRVASQPKAMTTRKAQSAAATVGSGSSVPLPRWRRRYKDRRARGWWHRGVHQACRRTAHRAGRWRVRHSCRGSLDVGCDPGVEFRAGA